MTELPDIPPTGICDLTTTGRRSGTERTIEIWYVVHEGAVHIVGTPGLRDWLANLAATQRAVLHLREPQMSVPVEAEIVTDPAERLALARTAWRVQPWYAQQGDTLEQWVAASPMTRLRPRG